MNEEILKEIAKQVFTNIFGDGATQEELDEIYFWLRSGDNSSTYTMADVPSFVEQWKEYYGIA